MTRIIPVPAGRSSDMLMSQRLTQQLSFDQTQMLRLQSQLSTGRRLLSMSDDAPAAIRGLTLQSLIERKGQIQTNLITSQSYLAASDVGLANASNALNEMRGLAVSMADSTSSHEERQAAAQQVQRAIQNLMDIGNQQFRGRHLFSGSNTTVAPFKQVDGFVQYQGNTNPLMSFADINLLFDTTVNGHAAFGAISQDVHGLSDLNPTLSLDTRLSDLRGGRGIDKGSFTITDGITPPVNIDISSANTVGDVVRLLEANPPPGRKITARIDNQSLIVDIDDAGGGNLTVTEVGAGRVAAHLGILKINGNLTNPIVGTDLNPALTATTKLDNILGTKAQSILSFPGDNNDVVINAKDNGDQHNGTTIQMVDDALLRAGPGLLRGNEEVYFASDLTRPQGTLDFAGADNSLLLTAKSTDGSLNGVRFVVDASAPMGNAATMGPVVDVGGVPTITLSVDSGDQTTMQTLVDTIMQDGRFAVGTDTSTGEGYDASGVISTADDGRIFPTSVTDPGVKAEAALSLVGGGNDLTLIANQAGAQFNNVRVVIDSSQSMGNAATASYSDDGTERVLTLQIDDANGTELDTLVAAIMEEGTFSVARDNSNSETLNSGSPVFSVNSTISGNTGNSGGDSDTIFVRVNKDSTTANDLVTAFNGHPEFAEGLTAEVDGKDTLHAFMKGNGTIGAGTTGTLAGGTGTNFDRTSGVKVQNGGQTHIVTFENAQTIEDLLNQFNGSGIGLVAEINAAGDGINVRSIMSGGDFSIGENGGDTATQLGIRTFTANTPVSQLNYGRGLQTADGTDLTITRNDGVELEIDLTGAKTIGDVLKRINDHPDNIGSANAVTARLTDHGNGIEIVDDNPPGVGRLVISQSIRSNAGVDLGLIPPGESEATVSSAPDPVAATAKIKLDPPNDTNTAFTLSANIAGTHFNDIQVEFVNSAASGDQAFVGFDLATQRLVIDIDPAATSVNSIISAINAEGTFSAELDTTDDATNNGNGIAAQTGMMGLTGGGTPIGDSLPATANIAFPVPNNVNTAINLEGIIPGTALNDVEIVFEDNLTPGDPPVASFDANSKRLTVQIEPGVTTAEEIVAAIDRNEMFNASLDRSVNPTNDGSGVISATGIVSTTAGGTAEVLVGRDVNPRETHGIFNTLIRLNEALLNDDVLEISRAVELLDQDISRLSFTRGELGARDQQLDVLKFRSEEEVLELKSSLSLEIEIDMVKAISDFSAKQASFEASLQMMGQLYRLTLLDYI
ncbi:MAG: hypothetical protein WDZ51_02640 [Pirellulaceae bacterium]